MQVSKTPKITQQDANLICPRPCLLTTVPHPLLREGQQKLSVGGQVVGCINKESECNRNLEKKQQKLPEHSLNISCFLRALLAAETQYRLPYILQTLSSPLKPHTVIISSLRFVMTPLTPQEANFSQTEGSQSMRATKQNNRCQSQGTLLSTRRAILGQLGGNHPHFPCLTWHLPELLTQVSVPPVHDHFVIQFEVGVVCEVQHFDCPSPIK